MSDIPTATCWHPDALRGVGRVDGWALRLDAPGAPHA